MFSDAGVLGPAMASPRGGGFEDDMMEALKGRRSPDAEVVNGLRVTIESTDLEVVDED